ncbi:hypothetical protein [Defluviimonas sp. SAOS-178_SWC]|uniref:hypothetical protein n=1 Tax=Defluviimonas sp. SAOS-178_SWC TaxID=3121287 RepID=UPI0032213BDA
MKIRDNISEVVLYSAFVFLFVAGLTTGLSASACRKQTYHGEKKLRFCSISLSVGSFLPHDAAKRSIIYVERGIALSELGHAEEAVSDFRRALDDVASSRASYRQRIVERLEAEEAGSKAHKNFAAAMALRN